MTIASATEVRGNFSEILGRTASGVISSGVRERPPQALAESDRIGLNIV